MTEQSMVCNGHKENNIEKCKTHELYTFDKLKCGPTNAEIPKGTMTIGTIPFPAFDHLYASSVENTETNRTTMSAARSYLNSCHLNIIEEQAKIIESQSQEIIKLRKQNESLIERIERMNRRLNINQCSRTIRSKYSNQDSTNENRCNQKDDQFIDNVDRKSESNDDADDESNSNSNQMTNTNENRTANFRIRFRQKEITVNDERRRCNKMVRFVEAKRSNTSQFVDKVRRNSAQTVDEKLKLEDAVLFLKSTREEKPNEEIRGNQVHAEVSDSDDDSITKRKRFKFPILTTHEPFYMAAREDICNPVTYTPTALEVPSFRVIERDNINPTDVPKGYFEDVTVEAAKERHLRYEIGERKRKKWDVQRIRELRQNERLKEKLRHRKSRWNKLESPKTANSEISEQMVSLFPDMKGIEKILITNVLPVTALGTSIVKVPSWGYNFRTSWMNDGEVETSQYEENELHSHQHQHAHPHHRESRSRTI